MKWELIRLHDGKVSVRKDGRELGILERVWQWRDLERILNREGRS